MRSGIAQSLFLGKIETGEFHPFPTFSTTELETLELVLDSVKKFLENHSEDFSRFDKEGAQPEEYINALKELGLFGLIIPEEYGGIGLSNAAYSRVLGESSSFDASTSLTIGAHSSIGMKGLLLFGSDEQKKKYLPELASGERVAAFCLTESGAGSDAASVRTTATKNTDGSWTLNGEKIWITNGAFARFFTVFARTDSEGGKLSAFIVEREFPGVSSGPKEDKLGIRASATTTVRFDNVKVPAENLLGEEGKGFRIAMEILNNGRTGLGGGCVGGMKKMIELACAQSINRKQFGKPISEYGLIREKIAQMTVRCYVTESVVRMVGHLIDTGHPDYSTEAAISKVFATEALWLSINDALQIAGGNGFMKEYPYERYLRDSRINLIFEGTNEILRLYIGLSGLKAVGEYLKEVGNSVSSFLNDPIKGFGVLSAYAGNRFTQETMMGLPEISGINPELKEFAEIFERATTSLARISEKLIKTHKKEITEKQLDVKRVAEISIHIFSGLAMLHRAHYDLVTSDKKRSEAILNIARIYSHGVKRQIADLVRRIEKSNEDKDIDSLAGFITEAEKYPWDAL
ncbi:MAG TPA: acyl-CoA dehydrogenase family protein [Oligoflexia bacterium]|nr:acyl-CoA dehydrogenase family protein [Oligoflexia bacterium]HMP48223.1 acyl-CoA dehydrogenase family protein [Oligoflexia bacterium]